MGEDQRGHEAGAETGYVLLEGFPDAVGYARLRSAAGLSPKLPEAAARGVGGTLHGVRILRDGELIGMGRIVGDGGCFFFVVDIAVAPAHQGRGLGKRIMAALDAWLRANAPETAHVALFADGEAKHLYAKYGFAVNTKSVGMDYRVGPKPLRS